MCWNKCMYCGRFISYDDFANNKAVHNMITPDSEVSQETFETFHTKCAKEEEKRIEEHQQKLKITMI